MRIHAIHIQTEKCRSEFFERQCTDYIGSDKSEEVIAKAEAVMATGVKMKDSCHIVCAEMRNRNDN